MKRATLSLWRYLTLIVCAIVGGALLMYGVYDAEARVADARTKLVMDTRNLARTVAASTAHDIITDAFDRLEQTLLRLATLGSAESLEVFDREGARLGAVVVAASGEARVDFTLRAFRPPSSRSEEILADDRLTIVLPIERGATIGWVRTSTSLAGLQRIRASIWKEVLVLLVGTLVVVAAALAMALRRATQPLAEATGFAESLETSRGQQLEKTTALREIGELTRGLNRLSRVLAARDAALAASELRKHAILEASMDCLITIDDQGRIIDFNPAAEKTFGYSHEEVVGRSMGELIVPPAMRAAHASGMRRYLETGEGPVLRKRVELAAVNREGKEFPVELVIVPFEIDGRPYFAGYLRDISEQKAIERERARTTTELQLQTERLRIGQSAAELLIMDWNIAQDELVWSGDPEPLRGPQPASGRYPTFRDQVHADDLEGFLQMRDRAIATLEGQTREYRIVRTDGAIRWVDSRQVVFPGPDGKAARMVIALHDITERKLALEDAHAAQEKLGRLLASSRIVIYVDTPTHDFRCTYMSDNARAVVGYDAAEFLADPRLWESRVHPQDMPEIHRDLDRLLKVGYFEHEYRFRHRDGTYRWMRDEQTLVRDAAGAPTEVLGAWWDISERRRAEEALASTRDRAVDAEATLHAAIENVSQGILMVDAQDQVVFLNTQGRKLLGMPAEFAAPGRLLSDGRDWQLAHGEYDHSPLSRDQILQYLSSRRTDLKGIELVRPNGTVLEVHQVSMPDGRMVRTYSDITERKRVQALLEQSLHALENQKAALDEHAIVSITDRDGNIVYANDKFVEASGYAREELIGQTHRVIKSGLHGPEFYRAMWETISCGRAWHGEIANRSKGGAYYWVASTIVPFIGADGTPQQYIAIRTDITQRKTAELALAEARTRELATGHDIQQSLLLGDVPRAWPLEIATFAQPSQGVDGDFYDFFAVHARCCDVLIGDVMGKGVTAALMGAGLKNQYGRVLSQLLAPGHIDTELPRPRDIVNQLHRRITPNLIRLDAFVTLAYCRIDLQLGRLRYIGAGHPPAILVAANGAVSFVAGDNLPLGIAGDERYLESERPFEVGDVLFLYSDGVTEARNAAGEEYGQERLAAHLRALRSATVPPAVLVQSVRGAVARFTDTPEWTDDFTIVAFQLHDARERLRSEEFRRDLSELTRLRRWVEDLSGFVLGEEATQRLVLAAVEVASNIVRHADVPVRAAAFLCHHQIMPSALRLDFYYLGTPYDRTAVPPPDFTGEREGGFGLYIVEQSVDEFSQSVLIEDVNCLSLVMQRHAERAEP